MNFDKIKEYNTLLLRHLSVFLNFEPDYIKKDQVDTLMRECGLSCTEAYLYLLASAMYFNVGEVADDRELFVHYFDKMVCEADINEYLADPYMKNIKIPEIEYARWHLTHKSYQPYEAFVYDDLKVLPNGQCLPQIAFFKEEYKYPCVMQNSREWMLITPNEINTMKEPIKNARGDVLTYGLGLGYYAYMTSENSDVSSVTVVEKDAEVIRMFSDNILPQFPFRDKIKIIEADAIEYAKNTAHKVGYDCVFSDIWHDASDGVSLYRLLKECEKNMPCAKYDYWIEKTLKYYM